MNAHWLKKIAQFLVGVPVLLGLAACGGGFEDVGPPPQVSLTVSTSVAFRGEGLLLRASAYAANGMEHVRFYRLDDGVPPVLLGAVWSPPPNWNTAVPINAGPFVSFMARACDQEGLCSDSNIVTVSVYQ
ncbi:MAG: hypothetical protein ACK53K_00400 [Burkholderiales bacterium]|jgi:hypothetical protein